MSSLAAKRRIQFDIANRVALDSSLRSRMTNPLRIHPVTV
jgi:hypothetical protein